VAEFKASPAARACFSGDIGQGAGAILAYGHIAGNGFAAERAPVREKQGDYYISQSVHNASPEVSFRKCLLNILMSHAGSLTAF